MKGIALIRLQIGHLDSVWFLMRHDTVALALSLCLPVSLYQAEARPFFPWVGFTARSSILGKRVASILNLNVFILDLHLISIGVASFVFFFYIP